MRETYSLLLGSKGWDRGREGGSIGRFVEAFKIERFREEGDAMGDVLWRIWFVGWDLSKRVWRRGMFGKVGH